MDIRGALNYAIRTASTTPLRSWLTIIGIIIGIVALVVILSVSEGVKADINRQLAFFGADKMVVVPMNIDDPSAYTGFSQGATSGKLFETDAGDIESIPGVTDVTRIVYGRATLEFRDKLVGATLFATDSDLLEVFPGYIEIESGRLYDENERNVVVLANDAAKKMFGKYEVSVGNIIVINGRNYRVVGVLKRIGTSLSEQDDSAIYIPYEDGRNLFSSQLSKDEISILYVQISEGFDHREIKDTIEEKLIVNHRVTGDEKDFSVITADFVNETVGAALASLSLFIFFIALIASFVGGIGIMNTMFMGVLERYREIGVLKALGSEKEDIVMIFLFESALFGLIGGVIGFVAGSAIILLISLFGIPYVIDLGLVVFSLGFSVFVGVIAGVLPAFRAASLDPVDALRYE